MMLNGLPVIKSNQKTPTRANGMEMMIDRGWIRDSNRDAMTI